jgi:transcriptional regulator with PAS, ATPase and Fis domain
MVLGNHETFSEVCEWVSKTLDNYGGLIVTTAENRIRYVSPCLMAYLSRALDNEKPQNTIEDYILENGLKQVFETGMPLMGKTWPLGEQDLVTFMLPFFNNDRLEGAILIILFYRLGIVPYLTQDTSYGKNQGTKYSFDSIIGNSLAIIKAKRLAWDIAATNSPVFIFGETGTGKELFAHAIHRDSPRKDGPFVAINCAGIPESLVESELFGYEAGAFTGAKTGGKPGKFELADNGTLFLDEVSELPLNVQPKLLRFLQEREIERIGGTNPKPVNVRIISASNVDLENLVIQGKFREDLFFRMNVFSVRIPPLRQRLEDITSLSFHFITQFNRESGTSITGLSNEALAVMTKYNWPGNVRELKNVIERACLQAKIGLIGPDDLEFIGGDLASRNLANKTNKPQPNLKRARLEVERRVVQEALELSGGNKTKACQMLNLSRTSLYKKLKELGLS